MKERIPHDASKVHAGIWFDVYQKDVEQFDGKLKTFEWVRGYDVAKGICIFGDKILVQEEREPSGSYRFGLPGGVIDLGEDPIKAIHREVREETGYVFDTCEPFETIHVPVGGFEGYRHTFILRNPGVQGPQDLDEGGEKIIHHYISFEEFIDRMLSGKLQLFELEHVIIKKYLMHQKYDELKNKFFMNH